MSVCVISDLHQQPVNVVFGTKEEEEEPTSNQCLTLCGKNTYSEDGTTSSIYRAGSGNNCCSASRSSGSSYGEPCPYPYYNVLPTPFPYYETCGSVIPGPLSSFVASSRENSSSIVDSSPVWEDDKVSDSPGGNQVVALIDESKPRNNDNILRLWPSAEDKKDLLMTMMMAPNNFHDINNNCYNPLCICSQCGITRTHEVVPVRITNRITHEIFSPITNEACYLGQCIRCNPTKIRILKEWQALVHHEDQVDDSSATGNKAAATENIGLKSQKSPLPPGEPTCSNNKSGKRCLRCGIRTHKFGFPLTTANVYEGQCIKCAPLDSNIPMGVLQKWQLHNNGKNTRKSWMGESNGSGGLLGSSTRSLSSILRKKEDSSHSSSFVSRDSGKGGAKRCNSCGVRTHKFGFPVTTADVYDGQCIKCSPLDAIPRDVLRRWQLHNASCQGILSTENDMRHMNFPPTNRVRASELAAAIIMRNISAGGSSRQMDYLPRIDPETTNSIDHQSWLDGDVNSRVVPAVATALPVAVEVSQEFSDVIPATITTADNPAQQACDCNVDESDKRYVIPHAEVQIRKGYCRTCGKVKTHRKLPLSTIFIPLTNEEVYKGRCVQCHLKESRGEWCQVLGSGPLSTEYW